MAAARNSSSSYKKFQGLVNLLYRYRVVVSNDHHRQQGLSCLSSTSSRTSYSGENKVKEQSEQAETTLPDPPKTGFSSWMTWLLGSVVSILVPLWKNKWENLPRIEAKVERVVEEVEVAAQVIDQVATTADKALTELANRIPNDQSKLKSAVKSMEHVSNIAAKDARQIENIINKVGDVKQDLEELEKMVEPVAEKIIHKNNIHKNN